MARIYYNRIKAGSITIDQVPASVRPQVQRMLNDDARRLESLTARR